MKNLPVKTPITYHKTKYLYKSLTKRHFARNYKDK